MTESLYLLWNPSEGIDLGVIKVRFYSLMFVIAFALGWYLMKQIFLREKEPLDKLDPLFIYTVFGTLLGARLGHVFFYDWDYYSAHLGEILLPFQFEPEFIFTGFTGLASHGAAIAVIIVMYVYSKKIIKKPLLWTLDRISIPVAIGGVFVRLGNFFNSEIIGHETTVATGVRFVRDRFSPREVMEITGMNNADAAYKELVNNPLFAEQLSLVVAKHPTQLYEAFGYVFVFLILMYMYWKTDARNKTGLIFGVFLILLWSVRFVVEFVKESQGGFESTFGNSLSTGQWLSIPFILFGVYLLFKNRTKSI